MCCNASLVFYLLPFKLVLDCPYIPSCRTEESLYSFVAMVTYSYCSIIPPGIHVNASVKGKAASAIQQSAGTHTDLCCARAELQTGSHLEVSHDSLNRK